MANLTIERFTMGDDTDVYVLSVVNPPLSPSVILPLESDPSYQVKLGAAEAREYSTLPRGSKVPIAEFHSVTKEFKDDLFKIHGIRLIAAS